MEGGDGRERGGGEERNRERERGRERDENRKGGRERERKEGRKGRDTEKKGKKKLTTKMIALPIKQILRGIAPVVIPLGDGSYAVPMVPPIAPVAGPEDVEAACWAFGHFGGGGVFSGWDVFGGCDALWALGDCCVDVCDVDVDDVGFIIVDNVVDDVGEDSFGFGWVGVGEEEEGGVADA